MPPDQYNSLLKNCIAKTYRKTELITKTRIDKDTRKFLKPLKLGNKMECYIERHNFITLKDHTENFKQETKCRLINLAKGETGQVSKKYHEQIIRDVNNITKFSQWRKTFLVIKCFQNITNKNTCSFINLTYQNFFLQFLGSFQKYLPILGRLVTE